MRYPVSCGSSGFTLSDGTSGGFNDWSDNIVRTCKFCFASGSGWTSAIVGSVVDQNDNVIIQTQLNSDDKISALPVDEYVRAVLGDIVFENLANGDTVTFANIHGLYQSGSLRQWSESSGSGSQASVTMKWKATMGPAVRSDTVLTHNNGSFGSYWVVVNGVISTSTVTLTTYTEATTTADYGFETASYEGAEYAYLYTKTNKTAEYDASLTSEIRTNDTEEFVLTDLDGSIVGSLPWGLAVQDYTFRCVISATSAYVQFRFDGLNSGAEGLQFTIPLPALDISSNSWSEYLYSGQREYDIEQRRVARERGLVEGLAGSLASGATGAMLGGLREGQSEKSTLRSTRNSAVFAGLGAGAGVVGSALNYAVAGYYNDVLQSAEDMLRAKQIDSLITAGNACEWLYDGRPYQIRSLVPDTYSLERFDEDVALNGLKVSEPTASCDSLIRNASGPLAIENLVVRGNILVEAKRFIKQKLNDGVRLI